MQTPIDLFEGLISGRFTLVEEEADHIHRGDEVYLVVKARAKKQEDDEKANGKLVRTFHFKPSDVWVVDQKDEDALIDILDAPTVVPALLKALSQPPVFSRHDESPENENVDLDEGLQAPVSRHDVSDSNVDFDDDVEEDIFVPAPRVSRPRTVEETFVPPAHRLTTKDPLLARFLRGE